MYTKLLRYFFKMMNNLWRHPRITVTKTNVRSTVTDILLIWSWMRSPDMVNLKVSTRISVYLCRFIWSIIIAIKFSWRILISKLYDIAFLLSFSGRQRWELLFLRHSRLYVPCDISIFQYLFGKKTMSPSKTRKKRHVMSGTCQRKNHWQENPARRTRRQWRIDFKQLLQRWWRKSALSKVKQPFEGPKMTIWILNDSPSKNNLYTFVTDDFVVWKV